MELFSAFLLLLNLDGPESLDALDLVRSRGVVVAFMGIDFGDTEGEHGEGQQLEAVLERCAVGDFWEERVLLAGFLVGRGLDSSERTFNCP